MAPLVLVEWQKKYIENLRKDNFSNPFQGGFIIDSLTEEPRRIFEVSGDSMNDSSAESIPDKAYVLGLEIKKESLTRNNDIYWNKPYILVCADRVICRQLTGFDKDEKTLQCHNLNSSPEFQGFELRLDDVLQVFKIVKKQH